MDEKKLEILVQKVDGVANDVRSNGYRLDKLENRIDQLDGRIDQLSGKHGERFDSLEALLRGIGEELRTLSSQFKDVGVMAIKDNGRITELEKRVDTIESQVH